MSQDSSSPVALHVTRLNLGANSYVVLAGGFLALGGLVFSIAVTGAPKGALISMGVFFVGVIVAVYNCGSRMQAADGVAKLYDDRTKLAAGLDRIESHIAEITAMSVTDYMTLLSSDTTDSLLRSVQESIRVSLGDADAALFATKPDVPSTAIPADHPLRSVEIHRVTTLDTLRHSAAILKKLILKLA